MKLMVAMIALGAVASCSPTKEQASAPPTDSIAELRAAEGRLVAHLEGSDPLAWVGDYTEDAVFQEGDAPPVSGRRALTDLAKSLGPLSGVQIVPVRTQISGRLAYVQVRGSYAIGKPPAASAPTRYRGVMIWRKDLDGQWRMLHEMLAAEPKD